MRLEGWGCHFPLGMAPSPACTRGVRSSVCSWAGVDMYSRDPIADGWSHDFRWAACLGLASRFLSSIGKSGKSPAGDFYLLISKTQSLTVKTLARPRGVPAATPRAHAERARHAETGPRQVEVLEYRNSTPRLLWTRRESSATYTGAVGQGAKLRKRSLQCHTTHRGIECWVPLSVVPVLAVLRLAMYLPCAKPR